MRRVSGDLAHALAAEYVLGTLRGRARGRFEAMMRADPVLADLVQRWEGWMTPLAQRVPPVDPPARVWQAIASRIAPVRAASAPAAGDSFWSSIAFWRPFGLIAGGAAAMLTAFVLYISTGPRGEPMFVAVLTSSSSVPMGVVSMHSPNLLRVRMVKPWKVPAGKSLELWVMPMQGAPRSLGLVRNEAGDTMMRIRPSDPRVQGAKALAISLEPEGGSPTQQPTGPMLCSGMIAPVARI
jgi:anti-sigma-K factor RskA